MSFLAKLNIDDQERNILSAKQVFSRFVDLNGRPTGKPFGKTLNFSIESTGHDSFFYNNMLSPTNKCQGDIVFYKRDGFSVLFKIEFANAQILSLSEEFEAIGNTPLRMNISIGWGIIKMRDVIHQETWNPNNPFIEVKETVRQEEKEGEIVEIYFENEIGKKTTRLRKNKKVFLLIKSIDMVGKSIDVDLSDTNFNFEYKTKILQNSQLLNQKVTSDLMKFELITRKNN
ncbi:type VI secretion system tube protein TssD [uncultured Algibacter sp.]|uniref:type VI secretion system tube protein TssD n=1 Tax=uncultured Algibacter sp. TaxID=298659 RepID=UPI003217C4DB